MYSVLAMVMDWVLVSVLESASLCLGQELQ